jgi:hypothetical protein
MPTAAVWEPSINKPAQPQLHSMSPPATKQNKARRCTARDLEAQRSEITKLWKNGYTLDRMIEFMREHHGLYAT